MASKLAKNTGEIEDCYEDEKQNECFDDSEQARLRALAKSGKRNRVDYFNVKDGVILHLNAQPIYRHSRQM